MVCSVPACPTRYYSLMAVDHFAHNFAYIGTRTTGGDKAVDLMISGPGWKGTAPTPAADTVLSSATSETNFVTLVHRLEVYGTDDYENGKQILKSCTLQTLSAYNGNKERLHPIRSWLNKPDFPPYKSDQLQRAGFFEYVNAYIAFAEIYPGEASYYARFARIGVYPGGPYPLPAMSPTLIEAIEQGIWAGNTAIESEVERPKGVSKNGWSYITFAHHQLEAEKTWLAVTWHAQQVPAVILNGAIRHRRPHTCKRLTTRQGRPWMDPTDTRWSGLGTSCQM